MIEVLGIIAGSWPLAVMVIGLSFAIVINRRLKQSMDDSQEVRNLNATRAVVVRDRFSDVG